MTDFMKALANSVDTSNIDRLNETLFAVTDPNKVDDKTILDVPISKLHTFKNHPFKVKDDDDKMLETIDSIKEQGIIYPIIIRPKTGQNGEFEIIAGHRRKRACELIGLETIPAIVKRLSDEESTIIMVDSNIQREELLFSEKAFAYKMKLDAIKNQGKRSDLTCGQLVHKLKTRDSLAENTEESGRQIQRYIRLTYLIKDLLDMVDEKALAFTTAVELSYLNEYEQQLILDKIEEICKPSLAEAKKFKEESNATNGGLTAEFIENILLNNFSDKTKIKENIEDMKENIIVETIEEIEEIEQFETEEINAENEMINPVTSRFEVISSEPTRPYPLDKPLRNILKKRKVLYKYFKDDVEEEEIEDLFIKLLEKYCANDND